LEFPAAPENQLTGAEPSRSIEINPGISEAFKHHGPKGTGSGLSVWLIAVMVLCCEPLLTAMTAAISAGR
jgi:hypothetical protein